MTKSMTPSEVTPITPGQIAKFYEVLVAALRKSGLPSEPTQQVLESQGSALADEFVASVRRRMDAATDMIVRRVKVNRSRSPQEALDATGRRKYIDPEVVNSMPGGGAATDEEVDVYFFKLGRYVSDDELEREYKLRGLKPADLYAHAAVNEADPAFADEHPNGTHWKDKDGRWCFCAFFRWNGERNVYVYRRGLGWGGDWRFAGVRK